MAIYKTKKEDKNMYKMGEVKTVCRRRRKTDEKRKRGTTVNNNVSLERSESERTRIL